MIQWSAEEAVFDESEEVAASCHSSNAPAEDSIMDQAHLVARQSQLCGIKWLDAELLSDLCVVLQPTLRQSNLRSQQLCTLQRRVFCCLGVQVYGLPLNGTRKIQRHLHPIRAWLHQHVAAAVAAVLLPVQKLAGRLCGCFQHCSSSPGMPEVNLQLPAAATQNDAAFR
jgi:hypothetical protein